MPRDIDTGAGNCTVDYTREPKPPFAGRFRFFFDDLVKKAADHYAKTEIES